MTSMLKHLVAVGIVAAVGASPVLHAQCTLARVTKPVSTGPVAGEGQFGRTVALHADVLAVADLVPGESGAVHVFVRSPRPPFTWMHRASFAPDDLQAGQEFGAALAVRDGTVVMGAPALDGLAPGAVYVSERDDGGTPLNPLDDTWTAPTKLDPPSTTAGGTQLFGHALACSGRDLFVSSGGASSDGRVGVFVRMPGADPAAPMDDTWSPVQALVPSASSSTFGLALDVTDDGDRLVVGDPAAPTDVTGRVEVFHRSGGSSAPWVRGAPMELAAGTDGGGLGRAVAWAGNDQVFASSPSAGYDFDGRVFVFDREDAGTPLDESDDTWSLGQTLSADDGWVFQGFGQSLDVDGDHAVIGEPSFGLQPQWGGSVWVYERSGGVWAKGQRYRSPDHQVKDGVGLAIAVAEGIAYLGARGAPYIDDWGPAEDVVYTLDLDCTSPWSVIGAAPLDLSTPRLAGWGRPAPGWPVSLRQYDIGGDDLTTVLIGGFSRVDMPFLGGILYPSPDVLVTGFVSGSFGDLLVEVSWPPGLTDVELVFQSWVHWNGFFPDAWRGSNGIRLTVP